MKANELRNQLSEIYNLIEQLPKSTDIESIEEINVINSIFAAITSELEEKEEDFEFNLSEEACIQYTRQEMAYKIYTNFCEMYDLDEDEWIEEEIYHSGLLNYIADSFKIVLSNIDLLEDFLDHTLTKKELKSCMKFIKAPTTTDDLRTTIQEYLYDDEEEIEGN